MGRPKGSKNKSTLLKQRFTLSDPITPDSTESVKVDTSIMTPDLKPEDSIVNTIKKTKKEEKGNICECCKNRVLYDLYRVDTNVLTGKADYHRSTPRYVKICNDCAKELSQLVENWLLNKGIEKKKGW